MEKKTSKKTLDQQAEEIIRIAEEAGVQTNYFFLTTFRRYQTQISVLNKLEEILDETDTLVTKEYVKGRENLYTNPAITEYNRTTDSANKTVSTLIRIINGFRQEDEEREEDPLLKIINGEVGDEDGEQ